MRHRFRPYAFAVCVTAAVSCASSGGSGSSGGADAPVAGDTGGSQDAHRPDGSEPGDDASDPGNDVPFTPECADNTDCTDPAKPICDATGACAAPPAGGAIGWGDGSPESVRLDVVFDPNRPYQATALDFHPTRDELWVVLREFPSDESCDQDTGTQAGCAALEGSVAIISDPTGSEPTAVIKKDLNAWHFMRRPTGIAFAEGDNFATCGEARTGNYTDDPADFMGPSLWTSDPVVFAKDPGPGLNGSHLDMLHQTPFCMGIAHESQNAFWTFNGQVGALERYDFAEDHGPGHDDHSDGTHRRYATGELLRREDVPSHLAFDAASGSVYVADTGHARVVRIDTTDATPGDKLLTYEPMNESREYDGAVVTELVSPGEVNTPSGLALHEGVLYVSDNVTSKLHAFDLSGEELRVLDTGLPEGTLAGVAVHAGSGRLYFVDLKTGTVRRVEPSLL